MKPDIHPKLNPVVFVDSSNGAEFPTLSTLSSDKTKKINGVEHYVISVDISSASHPFYTGEKMLIDTAGRVDKFKARQEAAAKLKNQHQKAQEKKLMQTKETPEERVTRKAKATAEAKEAEKAKKETKKAPVKKAAAEKSSEKKAPAKKEKPDKKK